MLARYLIREINISHGLIYLLQSASLKTAFSMYIPSGKATWTWAFRSDTNAVDLPSVTPSGSLA